MIFCNASLNIPKPRTRQNLLRCYKVYYLLYFEGHKYINNAIAREKEIKGWTREKKMKLISEINPEWQFLNQEVFGKWPRRIAK